MGIRLARALERRADSCIDLEHPDTKREVGPEEPKLWIVSMQVNQSNDGAFFTQGRRCFISRLGLRPRLRR